MGLGGMKYAWQRQTRDFAHARGHQYSSLVTDNRGIGDSDKPTSRYSTSAMAEDLIELLDHIGWTGERELHVIGISMGGMIAQEIVSSNTSSCSFVCRNVRLGCYTFRQWTKSPQT
jgi:pimeloyl-ACP methyl ester carboxylesterase